MTKAEIVSQIARSTGQDKASVSVTVEAFMELVKKSIIEDKENVYLRGFGSFVVKTRKAKVARIISTNEQIQLPDREIPYFRPAKEFAID